MPPTSEAGTPRRTAHAVRRAAAVGCVSLALAQAAPGPVAAAAVPPPGLLAAGAPGRAPAAVGPLVGDGPLRPAAADRLAEPGIVTDLPAEVPPPPALPAASYVLADLASGEILVAKAAHARRGPASTLKLLTAQTLAPRVQGDVVIRATAGDAGVDGTRVGMVPDAEYTADQLFRAMVMQSANDAAEALARANGGLVATLRQMNERAAQLGAEDTTAGTPHGLDAPGQQSSAYDLVTILRGALATPQVAQILGLRTATFPGGVQRGAKPFQIAGQNKLLWNYDGAIGGKDGFTDAAGHTYVGAARRGDKTYAVSFMGAASNDWRPTGALLDWAFAHGAEAAAVGRLPAPVGPVTPGDGPGAVALAAAGPGSTTADVAAETAAEGPGLATRLWGILLATLKGLLGTVAVLGVAAAGLRVRKLRRDARRREERRARQVALERQQERLAQLEQPTPVAAAAPADLGGDRPAVARQSRPSRPRSKERAGLQ